MRHAKAGTLLFLLLLLSVPLASAGTEESPEVRSPRSKPNPEADLLAAWVDGHPEGLLITFKIASLDREAMAITYVLRANIGGHEHDPTIGFDQNGALRTDSGENLRRWPDVDDALSVVDVQRGSPAYLTMVVPWGQYGLTPDSEIEVLGAFTSMCCEAGRWIPQYDSADAVGDGLGLGGAPFTVRPFSTNLPAERGLFPILVPSWVIPMIVLGCTAGGIAAGLGIARANASRAKPTPIATPVSVRAALPPPGERFRHAPPASKRS